MNDSTFYIFACGAVHQSLEHMPGLLFDILRGLFVGSMQQFLRVHRDIDCGKERQLRRELFCQPNSAIDRLLCGRE